MDKDRSIIAQNAGTTAAAIYNGLGRGAFDPDEYDAIRRHIFNGTLELAGAESVVMSVEESVQATGAPVRSAPAPRRNSGGGGDDPATLTIRSGKHAGKTIGQVADEDYDYLVWASENLKNDFLRTRIEKFLAAA